MRSASSSEVNNAIRAISHHAKDPVKAKTISAFPGEISDEFQCLNMTDLEISRFSKLFLSQHRRAVKGVLGDHAYEDNDIVFLVLPIKQCTVFTLFSDDSDYIILSLGFLELLRYEATISILQSVQQDASEVINTLVKKNTLGYDNAKATNGDVFFSYLQACAIRYFYQSGYLPQVEKQLPTALQNKISIILAPCLIFVILHELGHIECRRSKRRNAVENSLYSEFMISEPMNDAKAEELYADRYAFENVPQTFKAPLLHSALLFFNVFSYFEQLVEREETHPMSLNHANELYKLIKEQPDISAHTLSAIEHAINHGKHTYFQQGGGHSRSQRRAQIERFINNQKYTLNYMLYAKVIGDFYEQQG